MLSSAFFVPVALVCYRVKQKVKTFCRQKAGLRGDNHTVCRRQCIDRQHTQRWHTVNQNVVKVGAVCVHELPHDVLPAHDIDHGGFKGCQLDVCREQLRPLLVRPNAHLRVNRLVLHNGLQRIGQRNIQGVRFPNAE